jgi:hypothetical protein
VVSERLHRCEDGQVLWRLPRPWRDGTTHLRFDPCDFLGRLAVLVPRPRVNLLFYHGVVICRILTHLGIPAELPTPLPAQSPPHLSVFTNN